MMLILFCFSEQEVFKNTCVFFIFIHSEYFWRSKLFVNRTSFVSLEMHYIANKRAKKLRYEKMKLLQCLVRTKALRINFTVSYIKVLLVKKKQK